MTAGERFAKEALRKSLFRNSKKDIDIANYPSCLNTLDTCPTSINDLKNPPEQCWKCPQFKDSKFYKPKVDKERAELWKKIIGKG